MEQLYRETDKLRTDAAHLQKALEGDGDVDLALSIAKRVRRTSAVLVKLLAQARDDDTLA